MRKGIYTIVMAIFMVWVVLPANVQASEPLRLVMRWTGYDSSTQMTYEELNNPIMEEISATISDSIAFFYFIDENGQEIRLNPSQLSSSDTTVLDVKDAGVLDDMVYLQFKAVGNANIQYTYNGTVYSFPVTVTLPSVGCYSTTTAASESYLREYTVTDNEDNKFYIVPQSGKVSSVTLQGDFSNIATVAISNDNSYAEVIVTGTPKGSNRYDALVTFIDSNGNTYENWLVGLFLYNGRTTLGYSWSNWNNGVPSMGESFVIGMSISNGSSSSIYPLLGSADSKEKIDPKRISSSDESVLKVKADETHSDLLLIEAVDFGTAQLVYEAADSKTYTMEVVVGLPTVGYYTSTTASEETYLLEFNVTDEGPNTFYLVSQNGTLTNINLDDAFGKLATVELGSDATYAKVTITGTPENTWYSLKADHINQWGGTSSQYASIYLGNLKKSLECYYVNWDGDGNPIPTDSMENAFNLLKNSNCNLHAYFASNGKKEQIMAEDLVSSDESIVKVSADMQHPDIVNLQAVGWGTATVSYTHSDGNTYSIEVTVGLSQVGFYATPIASEETYISEFVTTEKGPNTFYLVSLAGVIDSVEMTEGFSKIATAQISEDGTYAEITITGEPEYDDFYSMEAIVRKQNGATNRYWAVIEIKNRYPSMQFTWGYYDNDKLVPNEWLYPAIKLTSVKGNDYPIFLYYVDGDNRQTINADMLKCSDESVIRFSAHKDDPKAIRIESLNWGKAVLSYTHSNDKVYNMEIVVDIPSIGYYTTPTATKEGYINSFTVTDDNNTFYLIAKDGNVFEKLTPLSDLQEIATITLSEDNTYAKVVVTGEPKENVKYGFEYKAISIEGYTSSGVMYIGSIEKEKTDEEDVNVEVDDLPTIDPTIPTDEVEVGVDSSSKEVLETVGTDIITTIADGENAKNVSVEVSTSIKAALESGADLKVTTSVVVENLDTNKVQDTATKQDVSAIERAKGEGQVAQYLNLSVVVTTYVDGTQDAKGTVSELGKPIVFTVVLPEEVKGVPEGYERSIYVLYVHNGVVKTIPVTENKDGTISFPANEFSTYALTYKDTKKISPVEAFVTRMYQQCLSRKPDQTGLEGWVGQLEGGHMNGAQIAEQFVFSNEMLRKNLSNGDFVDVLYRSMMGREADVNGKNGWVGQLNNGNMSRSQVTKAFVESKEFTNICTSYGIIRGNYDASMAPIEKFVTRFYTLCLNRPNPDQVGLYGWVGQLKGKHMNGAQIADAFFFSKEYVEKNTSNKVYVTTLYRTLMGREPDAGGLSGWVSQLERNYMTREAVMKAFIESPEFSKICVSYGIERGSK